MDQHVPTTDDNRASDDRVRKIMRGFMTAAARDRATTNEDTLRAAIGLLVTVARNARATRAQLVTLVEMEAATYLEVTDAELAAMGVKHVECTHADPDVA